MNAAGSTIQALVVGDNCLDCYRGEIEACYPGGNAVNVAVYLRRQGVATSYHGYIGDDAAGRYLRAALEQEGVDCSLVETLPGATGRTFVEVRGGERIFVGDDPGVQVPFHADLGRLRSGDFALIHFSAFTSWDGGAARCEPDLARELAALAGTALSVDFSDGQAGEHLFEKIGNLLAFSFFSRSGLTDAEIESFVTDCLQRTSGTVVVTRGSLGSAAGRRGSPVHFHRPDEVEVVDTLGAGDAFIAGYLAQMLGGGDLPAGLSGGTFLASQVIGAHGAWHNTVIEKLCHSFWKGEHHTGDGGHGG